MPISGIVLSCLPDRLDQVSRSIESRASSEVRERRDDMLVVVTDTPSLEADRDEVDALLRLDGVAASHVVFSNIEDAKEVSL